MLSPTYALPPRLPQMHPCRRRHHHHLFSLPSHLHPLSWPLASPITTPTSLPAALAARTRALAPVPCSLTACISRVTRFVPPTSRTNTPAHLRFTALLPLPIRAMYFARSTIAPQMPTLANAPSPPTRLSARPGPHHPSHPSTIAPAELRSAVRLSPPSHPSRHYLRVQR